MSDGSSLINLGDLSKPATVLIERVSDAVGGLAKPWQIKRVARAESEAEIIRHKARMDISETEQRALVRMIREEGQKQENMGAITEKSLHLLNEDAKPEDVDKDWITHLFDRARLTSDEDMHTLWAKLLAGEANNPGSYSKRTVDIISCMDKKDAENFTKFCSFVWKIGSLTPFIDDYEDDKDLYEGNGINFSFLSHLSDIGLIKYSSLGFQKEVRNSNNLTIYYYGVPVELEFSAFSTEISVGDALLTKAGLELAKICGSRPIFRHFEWALARLVERGYSVSAPLNGSEQWKALYEKRLDQ